MSSRWWGILVPILFALPALAQEAVPSRLDAVQKSGKLRICTPGDYTPFALQKSEGVFEGLDVDLVQTAAKALGTEAVFVKSAWPTLMKDFIEKCDVAVGGISVTLDRQKTAFFSQAYMINGKAPITRCENVAKSNDRACTDGQFTTMPTERLISISSIVQPSRLIADACPPITGPPAPKPLGMPGTATA